MAPFTVLAPTDEAFAAALEALDVTAEELLVCDDLADILKELRTRLFPDRWQPLVWRASVKGANRLGANFLLDFGVFDRQAAATTAELVKPNWQRH